MEPLQIDAIGRYVNEQFIAFEQSEADFLRSLMLDSLLPANPYLFATRRTFLVSELVEFLLNTTLLAREGRFLDGFLVDLAFFIAGQTCGGHKSTAQGVDLEFIHNNTHYVVSIKSGPNWGNSAQHRKLAQDLTDAVKRVKQSRTALAVEPVLGICYGKTRTTYTRDGYLKVVGQNFWYLISENKALYTDIIEPIGYRAKEHNETFDTERGKAVNRLIHEFTERFCDSNWVIDWVKLVEFSCGNYDLDKVLSQ
jgi:hypothetical protein